MDGLDALLKTPALAYKHAAGSTVARDTVGEDSRGEQEEFEGGGGSVDYSALEEDGVDGSAREFATPSRLQEDKRATGQDDRIPQTAAWKRLGRAKKERRAKRREEASTLAEEGLEGLKAIVQTPAMPSHREMSQDESDPGSPSQQLRRLCVQEDAEVDAARATRKSRGIATSNAASAGSGPETPPQVRTMLSKIDSFLERHSKREPDPSAQR